MRLPHLERTLQEYLCVGERGEFGVVAVDLTTLGTVDRDQLARQDFMAFKYEHDAFDEGLSLALEGSSGPVAREVQASLASSGRVEVDVWLAVDVPTDAVPWEDIAPDTEARRRRHGNIVVTALGELLAGISRVAQGEQYDVLTPAAVRDTFPIPVVSLRVTPSLARKVGGLPRVWRVALAETIEARHAATASENYMLVTQAEAADAWLGADGTGVSVGIHEGANPSSLHNLNVPAGVCTTTQGSYRCLDASLPGNSHVHSVMATMRNTVTQYGGVADQVLGHWCNGTWQQIWETCRWGWGITAMNRSVQMWHSGPGQTSHEMFMDYVGFWGAVTYAAAAGNNGLYVAADMRLRNGLVVGGTNDAASLAELAMWEVPSGPNAGDGSQGCNPGSAPIGRSCGAWNSQTEWELPHVVAYAENVRIASPNSGQTLEWGATSAAVPQVTGLVASIQEMNPALRVQPDAVMAGIIAGARGNPDSDEGGVDPLNLHDTRDDLDGAGLIQFVNTLSVLASSNKRDGGTSPAPSGYDSNVVFAADQAASTYYPETWNVRIPAGMRLRAAAVGMAATVCTTFNQDSCTLNAYPNIYLTLWEGSVLRAASVASAQNYQYLTLSNTGGAAIDRTLRVWFGSWNGTVATRLGIAWTTSLL